MPVSSSHPVMTTKKSSDIVKCFLGGQNCPRLRATSIEVFARDGKVAVSKPDVFQPNLDHMKCVSNLSKGYS